MQSQIEFVLQHHLAFSLLAGFLLDCIVGDPHCLPHPVRFMGRLISFLERRLNKASDPAKIQRLKGFILVFCLISVTFLLSYGLIFVSRLIHPFLSFFFESLMCWNCIAAKSLYSESMKVCRELKKNDLNGARKAVSMIVGRDTDVLDEKGVAKAAVETVAENTSDGVVAPVFFIALFGASGGMVYKAINTMDSMIAYKNERFKNFGFFAARLDDAANLIPARFSAILMVLSALILAVFPFKQRFRPVNAVKIFFRDRYKHASPNSAQTESVVAGALGLQLAGDTVYEGKVEKKDFIGDALREVEANDIFRSNLLMYAAAILAIVISVWVRA